MIYMKAGGHNLVILEPYNIGKVLEGLIVKSPDNQVLIAYCPDVDWLSKEITKTMGDGLLDVEKLDKLLQEGLKRPKNFRPDEKMKRVI